MTQPPPHQPNQPPYGPGGYPPPQQYPPAPPGHYPPPQGYYPPPQRTVTTSGLPGWMHAIYAILTVFTCGLAGIAWGIHWWFAKSKSSTTQHY